MTIERQITGGKFSGKVAGCVFFRTGDPDEETSAAISLEVPGKKIELELPESEILKIRRGDNVYVTVEITRDPE